MQSRSAAPFDAEFRLVLACSKLPADEVLVRHLSRQVQDWEKLLRYAEGHELTPLICHTLIGSGCSLSSTTSDHLMRKVRAHTQKNLLLTAELLRIMRTLLAENIRAIPYKGPVLAACAYGSLAMRGFCDLDVLVPEADMRRALRIMPELGYRAHYPLTAAQEARYLRSTCEYNFVHQSHPTQVEIHWQVVPPQLGLRFEFDQFWSRARSLPIGGSELPVLSPEDALLVLSVHGFKHLWSCLKWVGDVANLLSSAEDLDWSYVLDVARRMGAMRVVLVGLGVANQLFESRLPDPIRASLRGDSVATAIAREVVSSYAPENAMSGWKKRLLTLRAFSGFRNRACYLGRVLFDPTTEEAVRAPERSLGRLRTERVFHVAQQAISDFRKSRRA
jgi:hypothetical protein